MQHKGSTPLRSIMKEEDKETIERWDRPPTAKEVIDKANRARLNAIKIHQKKSWFQRIFGRKVRLY